MNSLLAVGALCIAFTLSASGQVQTKTTTAPEGAPTKTIKVERGTVVYVSGNSCVIKAEDVLSTATIVNVQSLLILCMVGNCHSQFVPNALSALWIRLGTAIRMVRGSRSFRTAC